MVANVHEWGVMPNPIFQGLEWEQGICHKKHEISQKHQVERAVPARFRKGGSLRRRNSLRLPLDKAGRMPAVRIAAILAALETSCTARPLHLFPAKIGSQSRSYIVALAL